MIVLEIDIQGGFALPAKSDPIIPGRAQRPPLRLTLQAVKVKARYIQFFRLTRHFQQLQDANALPEMIGSNPAGLAGEINLLQSLVPELADHSRRVDYLVYTVKRPQLEKHSIGCMTCQR